MVCQFLGKANSTFLKRNGYLKVLVSLKSTAVYTALSLPTVSCFDGDLFWPSSFDFCHLLAYCSSKLSPLSPSPPPSEFFNDEENNVILSPMDAFRNSKNTLLTACNRSLFICVFQFDLGCTSYLLLPNFNPPPVHYTLSRPVNLFKLQYNY